MVDRFLLWLGATALMVGLAAATFAGAGIAAAQDDSSSAGGAGSTASDAGDASQDSTAGTPGVDREAADPPAGIAGTKGGAGQQGGVGAKPSNRMRGADEREAIGQVDDERPAEFSRARKARDTETDSAEREDAPLEPTATPRATIDGDAKATEGSIAEAPESDVALASAVADAAPPVQFAAAGAVPSAPAIDAAAVAPTALPLRPVAVTASPMAARAAAPTPLNVIGTIFFSIFQAVQNLAAGQPSVPPGSTVRVSRTQLTIDCGPGYVVDADWYFPTEGPPPERLIYFQHGFPSVATNYDYTAAELAERNQAIVVAPSISGNIFDCYGCQLGGDPMHAAVAKLFVGDRAALLASATAAGFEGAELPKRFVIAGHSGGGQLAGGAAGYFEEFAPVQEDHNLAGVLLLDTSPIGGAIARGLAKIPDEIPVYTIAAEPNLLNSFGGVEDLLTTARPNQFVGVRLVNGMHGDSFQSHNPIVQLSGAITSFGFPRPENVEAVHILIEGWVDDWYEGSDTGIDGDLGSIVDIPTNAGIARAYVLPAPAPRLTFIEQLLLTLLESTGNLQFGYCAADPSSADGTCSAAPSHSAGEAA